MAELLVGAASAAYCLVSGIDGHAAEEAAFLQERPGHVHVALRTSRMELAHSGCAALIGMRMSASIHRSPVRV